MELSLTSHSAALQKELDQNPFNKANNTKTEYRSVFSYDDISKTAITEELVKKGYR